jgi:hypothetical protein
VHLKSLRRRAKSKLESSNSRPSNNREQGLERIPMKYIFYLIVGVSTFSLGCALASLQTSKPQSINSEFYVRSRIQKKPLLDGIEPTERACGNGYAQGYELPDGKKMAEGNDCFSSFQEAQREMKAWLKESDQLIETVAPPKYKGESRSERIIASFPKDEFGNEWVRIMWVHRQCIHWIRAPDLAHALEFEKSQFNPYKFEE